MNNLSLQNSLSKEIFNATQKFNSAISIPQQRNLRELIRGMTIAESSYLGEIGNVSASEINKRKNTERLSNTLSKIDPEKFHIRHISSKALSYRNEPVLLFADGGDIQKPYAKKMEKVCKNVDGSKGHRTGKGYPIFSVAAYGLHSKKLHPLAQHLWSTKEEEFKSEWCEYQKVFFWLSDFVQSSPYDRIVIEDRGGDDEKRFLYYTKKLHSSFITRVCLGVKSRKVIIENDHKEQENVSIQELSKRIKEEASSPRRWKNKKVKKTLISKIAFKKVFFPSRKNIPLYAIFCYSEGYADPLVVLTDLQVKDANIAWKYFFYYKKRWEIENFFRAEKQNLKAEKFLIRDFNKIKALTFLFMFVISFLAELRQKIQSFLGNLYLLFQDFCRKEQRSGEHKYLDILAFLKDSLQGVYRERSTRFCSQYISKHRSKTRQSRLRLFDLRKNW